MKNYKYLFLIIFLCFACTKEIPFPEIEDNPIVVVNSLFNPESELLVQLSESCHVQDINCELLNLEEAEVHLLDQNGTVLSTLDYIGEGIYSPADYAIEPNVEYHIEVDPNKANLSKVSSKTKVPKAIASRLIGFEEGTIDGQLAWGFDIEIDDDPDVENYYVIDGTFDLNGVPHGDFESELNGYIEPHFRHYSDDPNTENKTLAIGFDFTSYALKSVYLPDENFNGQKYTTRVGISDEDLFVNSLIDVKANLSVKSVSKEMYDYLVSLEELRLRTIDPFAEPLQVYSNIENGLGIFAGYTMQEHTVELPQSDYKLPSTVNTENDGCTAPCTVNFTTDGGLNLSYFWDFGDGGSSTVPVEVEHTYTSPGTYEVSLEATNNNGSGSLFTFPILIN